MPSPLEIIAIITSVDVAIIVIIVVVVMIVITIIVIVLIIIFRMHQHCAHSSSSDPAAPISDRGGGFATGISALSCLAATALETEAPESLGGSG